MTDATQHVLVARILSNSSDPSLAFGRYFSVQWSLAPGSLFYLLLAQLQAAVGPFRDVKLFLSLWVLALWASGWIAARSIGHTDPGLAAVATLPVAFSWYVYMGLLPFILTFPLFLLTVSAWCGTRGTTQLLLTALGLVCLFLCHAVGAAAGLLAVGIVAMFASPPRTWLRSLGRVSIAAAPVTILLVAYVLGNRAPTVRVATLNPLVNVVDVCKFTVTTLSTTAALAMLVWSTGVLLMTLAGLRYRLTRPWPFLAAAASLVVLAIVIPSSLGSLWPAGPRLVPFALLLTVVALPLPGHFRGVVLPVILMLLLGMGFFTYRHAARLDGSYRDLISLCDRMAPGRRLLPILLAPDEGSRWVAPFWSLGSACTVQRGGMNPYVFATPYVKTGASPLAFRRPEDRQYAFLYERPGPASRYRGVSAFYDYVLLWGESSDIDSVLEDEMVPVAKRGRGTLFAAKALAPQAP
jgi:hypothetical protein